MKAIAIKIRIGRRKRKKILKRLVMFNQVETGPANEKIVKNEGSCATFFFFFIFYFCFEKKKKKKKRKRANEIIYEHGLVFSRPLVSWEGGSRDIFFFWTRYTSNSDQRNKNKEREKKNKIENFL